MRAALFVIVLLFAGGCGTSKENQKASSPQGGDDELRTFESDFRPSDYDPEPATAKGRAGSQDSSVSGQAGGETPTRFSELVPGFRVQILATANIDEANAKKAEAEAQFPGEWFYIEYDPPTYKIRAGNFLNRFEADRFVRLLSEKGYQGAWTVPEKVQKQPPPPPPTNQPRPRQ